MSTLAIEAHRRATTHPHRIRAALELAALLGITAAAVTSVVVLAFAALFLLS